MDFMKIIDQTVRDIKREVNLKVLKVPEIEQKVLDVTSDEPWGPHGSDLAELALATKKFTECQMIMDVLWRRLNATDANWRHTYKALAVVEYLLANGSEGAVGDILDHTPQISKLSSFQCVEPSGKDVGTNVRKKVQTILSILEDKEKLQQVREKASATRDKYVGLSSSAMSYKSSSSAFSSDSYSSSDHYGSFSNSREADSFKDSYKDSKHIIKDRKSSKSTIITRAADRNGSKEHSKDKSATLNNRSYDSLHISGSTVSASQIRRAQQNIAEDDYDDFDPRGSSASRSSNQVDLFGPNLMDDLMAAPESTSTGAATVETATVSNVDLFTDSSFQSVTPQSNVDLFAGQPLSSAIDQDAEFVLPENPKKAFEEAPSLTGQLNGSNFDPFASIPLDHFAGSGTLYSSSDQERVSIEAPHASTGGLPGSELKSDETTFGEFTAHSAAALSSSAQVTKTPTKSDTFQVKSGIWADSLSRGLIDLNITAPKRVNLADIGIVGGLGDAAEEGKGPPALSHHRGRAMGAGSGLGRAAGGFPSSQVSAPGGSSNLGQHQFGSFQ